MTGAAAAGTGLGLGDSIPFLPIPGTWAWRGSSVGQWYHPASPWSTFMATRGFHTLTGPDGRGFVWSTDVNGQKAWRRWLGLQPDTVDWQCGGQNLYAYLVPPLAPDRRQPPAETHLIAHSHGLQPCLFACADGLKVNTLISIGSPVRADMLEVAHRARRNIGYWIHVHSDRTDRMQWLGEIGDGVFRFPLLERDRSRVHPEADLNCQIPAVGHSRVLTDPSLFDAVWPHVLDTIRRRHGRSDFV